MIRGYILSTIVLLIEYSIILIIYLIFDQIHHLADRWIIPFQHIFIRIVISIKSSLFRTRDSLQIIILYTNITLRTISHVDDSFSEYSPWYNHVLQRLLFQNNVFGPSCHSIPLLNTILGLNIHFELFLFRQLFSVRSFLSSSSFRNTILCLIIDIIFSPLRVLSSV